jgi:hypothetical protein
LDGFSQMLFLCNTPMANGSLRVDTTSDRLYEQQYAAGDAYLDAMDLMLKTRPTTIAGVIALLKHVSDSQARSLELQGRLC